MRYFIAILFSIALISCSKKESAKNLHLTVNVKGLKKGTIYIQKIVDTSFVALDTIKIDGNSQFTTDLNIESPEMYYLFLDRGVTNSLDNNLSFFAEAGNMSIETTLEHFLSDAQITGSKNQDKYTEFKKITSRFRDRDLDFMEVKLNAFKNKNARTMDSISKLQNAAIKKRYLYTANFALNNNHLEVAPFVALSEIPDINLKFLDTIQKSMTPKVAKSYYGKKLVKFYEQRKKAEQKQ